MDAQQLISEFLASDHGAQATQALAAQGVDPAEAQELLGHSAQAACAQAEEHHASLMGEHAGKSFFSAFAAGLVRGDGFMQSLVDGGEGVVTGRVAESLATNAGVDASRSSTIAAAATPFVMAFLKQKLG